MIEFFVGFCGLALLIIIGGYYIAVWVINLVDASWHEYYKGLIEHREKVDDGE